MTTLVYNMESSDLTWAEESEALRAAYLFSGNVIALGTLYRKFYGDQMVRGMKSYKQRVDWMEDVFRNEFEGEQLAIMLDNVRTFRRVLPQVSKINRESSRKFREWKVIERELDGLFEQSIGMGFWDLHRSPIYPLRELVDDETFTLVSADPVNAENEVNPFNPASRWMYALSDAGLYDAGGTRFLLSTRSGQEQEPALQSSCGGGPDAPLFSLPSLNQLTLNELRHLRQQLHAEANAFQESLLRIDEWARGGLPAEAIDWSGLQGAASALCNALQASPIFKATPPAAPPLSLHICYHTLRDLWDHFDSRNALQPETLRVINTETKRDQTRVVSLWLHKVDGPAANDELLREEASAHRKRSIDIN